MLHNSERIPTQAEYDAALEGWRTDPIGMRRKMIDVPVANTHERITRMALATQEEAAAGCALRGEPSVIFTEQYYPCVTCENILGASLGLGPRNYVHISHRHALWMGPRGWVCEWCNTPFEKGNGPDFIPDFKQAAAVMRKRMS